MFKAALRGFPFCLLMAAMSDVSPAQSLVLDLPLPSQRAEVSQRIGMTDITINYHRPLVKDRKIWDGVVPYGKVWRAGANVSTQLTTEVPLKIGAGTVKPGSYTLFVDLKQNNWTLVVSSLPAQAKYDPNEKVAVWGGYNYTPDKDVLRAKMTLQTLPHAHEELSWEFVDMTATGGTIALTWDKTQALVPFTFVS